MAVRYTSEQFLDLYNQCVKEDVRKLTHNLVTRIDAIGNGPQCQQIPDAAWDTTDSKPTAVPANHRSFNHVNHGAARHHHPRRGMRNGGGGGGGGSNRGGGGIAHVSRPLRGMDMMNPGVRQRKEITACLNKLNADNFAKVSVQIERSFFMDLDGSMLLLLNRCHMQSDYLPQFVRLFHNLQEAATDGHRDDIQRIVDSFVNCFLTERAYGRLGTLESNKNDYTAYCEWVKCKATTLGKHKTILAMMIHGLTDAMDIHSYFGTLVGAMYDWNDGEHDNIEVVELIIDMLSEFFHIKSCKQPPCRIDEWRRAMRSAYDDADLTASLTKKCRFKLLNIIEHRL